MLEGLLGNIVFYKTVEMSSSVSVTLSKAKLRQTIHLSTKALCERVHHGLHQL
jgi:hypothetical protein